MNRKTKADGGFTLVEMIVALVLGGIIVAAISPIFLGNAKSYYAVTSGNENIQAARIGFNRIMADLREINRSTSIVTGNAVSITFTDVNSNVITYTWSGSTVTRTKTGVPLAVLIPSASSFQIDYLDNVGATVTPPVAAPANVWRIQVTMQVTAAGQTVNFQSTVNPRMMPF
jgi:prepilin-type N-terminal cleavage/methylation domain-containing protein